MPGNSLPAYPTNVTSYPYIATPTSVTSALFPASTVTWPYCQGINSDPPPAYAPNYTPWQTTSNQVGQPSAAPQVIEPSIANKSYGTAVQATHLQGTAGNFGSFGFGLGMQMSDMQDYPSPHSDVSVQTASSCPPVLPGAGTSPNMPLVASPSVAASSLSRDSSRKSQEPPRNAEGLLYCNFPKCTQQPRPVFSRKCEWT